MNLARREFVVAAGATLAALRASPAWSAVANDLSDAAIREILAARIDRQRNGVGLVAGVVSPSGTQRVNHGRVVKDDPRTPDADTVFEIASLTKIFTGLILTSMVQSGELGLDDPLARHLPGLALPERDGRAITLVDLATHTSGLPQFPTNPRLPPDASADVFPWYLAMETYTEADLAAFLAGHRLASAPGERWAYSNVGFVLLGMALCRRAGTDFEELVTDRILRPLGMRDTAVTPTAAMQRRMVTPHELNLRPVARQSRSLFTPSGGLLSTANDLMILLDALMPGARSAVAAANELALATRRPGNEDGFEQAIGWEIRQVAGRSVCWKLGGSRGCSSALGHDRAAGKGMIVLGNSDYQVADIGRHILVPEAPLRRQFVAVDVSPDLLDRYLGSYRRDQFQLDIVRVGDGIGSKFQTFPPLMLTPIAATTFLNPEADTEFEFRAGADGRAAALILKPTSQPPIELARVGQGARDVSPPAY